MISVEKEIVNFARRSEALLGFAPAERWDEYGDVPPTFRPKSIWKHTETVIVLGLQVLLPMLDTTPSIVYATLYQTCNTELDQLAFNLCRILNRRGHPSLFMPRDGYGNISVLVEEPTASFSQVYAAKYGGLGTVGYNHTLLTPQYGPRVRLVSIFTSLKIPGSNMLGEELCTRCRMCAKCCPTKAFQMDGNGPVGAMDKKACAIYHAKLKESYRFPCGVCIKVCPVGEDRKLYGSENVSKYLSRESSEEKKGWLHCQTYGGNALD